MTTSATGQPEPAGQTLWYKDAIIYEVHVRAFADSDGDGSGDFRGLTAKLDYLQDLGVTAVWLLPFYPSPLRDDGYDISDYTEVNPTYGTIRDVRAFIREAHLRGLKVITELVCNHTSDQHPWFQRARRAPAGSALRNFYVWSDNPQQYGDARVIFKDFETSNWTWDPVAGAYYWHRFYRHQPDLNFDNPQVRKAITRAMDFWLQLGVDGLRLDTVPYLFEREGTSCENLPETHAFLKQLRRHIDERFPERLLLAEANQWPEDAAAYFGDGDECQMSFHFPLMPRLFMAIHMESRFPILDILAQTPAIPDSAQWALFLRNHDELTLEMVTDEERDYMYRVYASDPQSRINLGIRRRLAPLLQNNRRRIELMNGLLFSLPGTPVLYYGDEIGMGDNIYLGDRNGVRTPMQWTPDRNAGFSAANRQQLYLPVITDPEYHYEAVNVATQQQNPSSLLWWTKRLIGLRKRYKAFGRGSTQFLQPTNRKVLAFVRRFEGELILVVANLSRFAQGAELDLAEFRGMAPVELFGRIPFPPIGDQPYFITLGPHEFFWFALEAKPADPGRAGDGSAAPLPELVVSGEWERLLAGPQRAQLSGILPGYLRARRWFGGKAREIRTLSIEESIPLAFGQQRALVTMLRIEYVDGKPETYVLPLACASEAQAERLRAAAPQALIATVHSAAGSQLLFDALWEPSFCHALLETIIARRQSVGEQGTLSSLPGRMLRQMSGDVTELEPRLFRSEQSNSSIIFGNQLILKVFRKIEEGLNPDLELGRFMTEKTSFRQIAPVAGSIEYRRERAEPISIAILQGFVANEGDSWQYTLDLLGEYLERAAARLSSAEELRLPTQPLLTLAESDTPTHAGELIGPYLESARLLGRRTAEMHLALASGDEPSLAPEPFTPFYVRSVYQSMRSQAKESFTALRERLPHLPEAAREGAARLLTLEPALIERYQALLNRKLSAMRTRVHGDYHLGQVLFTGDDFVIIDFEGEPARSLSDRRQKRTPLRDVAGMLRSFEYAAATGLNSQTDSGGAPREQDRAALRPWADFWVTWVSAAFLNAYLTTARGALFMPSDPAELATLLNAYILDKTVYELSYELNNRPDWVSIPLGSLLQMLSAG